MSWSGSLVGPWERVAALVERNGASVRHPVRPGGKVVWVEGKQAAPCLLTVFYATAL